MSLIERAADKLTKNNARHYPPDTNRIPQPSEGTSRTSSASPAASVQGGGSTHGRSEHQIFVAKTDRLDPHIVRKQPGIQKRQPKK